MVGIDTQSHDTIEEQALEDLRPIQARITYQIVNVLNLRFISDLREQSPCSYLFPRIDIDRLEQDKDNGS